MEIKTLEGFQFVKPDKKFIEGIFRASACKHITCTQSQEELKNSEVYRIRRIVKNKLKWNTKNYLIINDFEVLDEGVLKIDPFMSEQLQCGLSRIYGNAYVNIVLAKGQDFIAQKQQLLDKRIELLQTYANKQEQD